MSSSDDFDVKVVFQAFNSFLDNQARFSNQTFNWVSILQTLPMGFVQ